MTKNTTKKPPQTGAELRAMVTFEHEITTGAAMALLDCACQALDVAVDAERLIKTEGMVVQGERGPRPHPAVAIGRDARLRMVAALKSLHLDL